jgi:hypothetical protein
MGQFRPNHYMNYYTLRPANRRLPWPTGDRATKGSSYAYMKTRASLPLPTVLKTKPLESARMASWRTSPMSI